MLPSGRSCSGDSAGCPSGSSSGDSPVEAAAKTGAEGDVGGALLAGLWEEPVAVTLVDDGTQNCPFGMQFRIILLAATHGADDSRR